MKGTDVGTAFHAALQHIDYRQCNDEASVNAQLERMEIQQLITKEQLKMVDSGKLARFFASEIGQKLRACDDVLREFKFSILDDGRNYDSKLNGEQILLQGVVDCALIENDGITVLDFKTDFVTSDTIDSRVEYYRPQVTAYADALSRIYELPVKHSLLYFFHLEQLKEL